MRRGRTCTARSRFGPEGPERSDPRGLGACRPNRRGARPHRPIRHWASLRCANASS